MQKTAKISPIVAPVRIVIDATKKDFFLYLHNLKPENSRTFIPNPVKYNEDVGYICAEGVEMDNSLFEKILSVNTLAEAESIVQVCNEHGLLFSFHQECFSFSDDEIGVEMDDSYLLRYILKEIKLFKCAITIYNAIKEAANHPNNYELVSYAFKVGERNRMGITYDPCDPETLNDNVIVGYNDKIGQYVAITEYQLEVYEDEREFQAQSKIERDTLIKEMLNDEDRYTSIASYASFFLSSFINNKILQVVPRQDAVDSCVSLLCPTVISAMYQRLLFLPYNNMIYRKCNHKHCNRFFRVDSHHPQSLCDYHMEPRRRKRKNYKK